MASRSVQMYEVRVPLASVQRMPDEDRYAYYVLGHMFNEIMMLQKMVAFSLPKHQDVRPARIRPELSQSLFLFRIASSKIWEAMLTINSKEVSGVLRAKVLPHVDGGAVRLKQLNKAINSASWLSNLRNGLGFHFPTYEQWKPFVTPDADWIDDVVYVGEKSGNTFYDAADSIALHWMFQQFGDLDIRKAVEPLVNEMIELLRVMNSFLEDALGVFIAKVLLDEQGTRKEVGKVIAPRHERVSIPFWTAMG